LHGVPKTTKSKCRKKVPKLVDTLVISDDLDNQAVKIKSLEEKAVQMKVSLLIMSLASNKPTLLVLLGHLFLVRLFLARRMHLWPAVTFLAQFWWPSVMTFLHFPWISKLLRS
jgi:hypothetical protein